MPEQTATPASWDDLITAFAQKSGVDPRLAHAVASVESNTNVNTKPSSKGAIGIMQLMPETASRLGVDPNDPVQNIQGGITELKRLLDEHHGDVVMALRRYNGSPTASEEATNPYVQSVLGRLQSGGQKSPGEPTIPVSSAAAPSPPPPDKFLQGYPKTQGAVRLGLKALPVAGGIAGGILGSGVPGVGTALGAGLLAGAGEGLRRASESAAGFAPPSTLAEQAEGAALAGGATAAGGAVLGAAGRILPGAAVRLLTSPVGRAAAGAAGGGLTGYEMSGHSPYGAAAGALAGAGYMTGGSGTIPDWMLRGPRGAVLRGILQEAEKRAAVGAVGAPRAATGTEVATQTSPLADVLMQRAAQSQPGVEIPRNLVLSPEEFQRLDQLRQAMKPVGSTIGAAYQRFGQGGVR